jgi:hypothetical protein
MSKDEMKRSSKRSSGSLRFEEEEIFGELYDKKGSSLFLGKYSMTEVKAVLKKWNFFKDAKKKKLWPLKMELDSSDFPPLQRLQIFLREKKPENIVADLKIREGGLSIKDSSLLVSPLPSLKYLVLEWLTLQNPLLVFSKNKHPLPGQKHPGLNLGRKVLRLFTYIARLNRDDGILAYPCYFHNALLFMRRFHFLNPEKEGEVLSIYRTFKHIPFNQLAWAVHLNGLLEETEGVYKWEAEEQVFFLNKKYKSIFESQRYKSRVKESFQGKKYSIDWDSVRKKMKAKGLGLQA